MIRSLTLAALAAVALAPVARAQNEARTSAAARKAPVSDPLFAAAAASGGLAEVSLSQLGLKKATSEDLKQFSQRMIDEHSKVNAELMSLAKGKGMTLPRAPDSRATFCAESLAGLSGEEFDRCYAKAQLLAHMDAEAAFEAEAERGADPEVKAFAAKTLPHIQEHLKTIKPIAMKAMEEEKEEKGEAHSSGRSR